MFITAKIENKHGPYNYLFNLTFPMALFNFEKASTCKNSGKTSGLEAA